MKSVGSKRKRARSTTMLIAKLDSIEMVRLSTKKQTMQGTRMSSVMLDKTSRGHKTILKGFD